MSCGPWLRVRRACCVLMLAISAVAARAQVNDFGVGGILDIPSARMQAENTFTTTYSRKDVADIYTLGFQAAERLEVSFRYTIFNAREYSPIPGTRCVANAEYCDGIRDRSFEVRYRLFDETDVRPAVVVGIRDLLGTGQWGAEYVAASKKYGDLDLTLGMGWGRLAERRVFSNPLTTLSDQFKNREEAAIGGGQLALRSYFRGEGVGIFGGLRYSVPGLPLDLVAAYNSDSYQRERDFKTIPDAAALSYGLEWEATPGVRLGVSWQQGNSLALKLAASLDAGGESRRKAPNGFGTYTGLAKPADLDAGANWWTRFVVDAETSGLLVHEMDIDDTGVLRLRFSNGNYQVEADAIRRVLSLIDQYAPTSVQRVALTGTSLGMSAYSVKHTRSPPDRPPVFALATRGIEIGPPQEIAQPDEVRAYRYPNGEWNFGLNARAYLFDPDFPLLYQLALRATGDVDFGGGWGGTGVWVQSLKSQFGRIEREGESQLPPVRTELKNYLQQGASGIDQLTLVKRGKLSRDIYFQAYGGILEEMYSGVGVDTLWRRPDSNIALGANINAVVQRGYDKMFGVRDLRTVTGHVSAFWVTPFKNVDVALHAGRYLAGDIGATLEVQKRFANGWTIGAFATLTDVPFSVFGEGAFDKGLVFTIPFDLYSPKNTRGAYRTILRSVNRDGGRMLDNWPGSLWENMRSTHQQWLRQTSERMIPE
ncbi:MAG: YjbH domain-containing protein [Gammaproteobacteria bacterium]|nr:YjbH domain-containing protein [Gammaproteobacteria bacterium]MBM4229849.1 YjbH domain-containing protein [Gammaproteobacteria bacterium]